tara:strand:- start:279 stop:650 length:372 start_codon:yes stop_codon:yes gene_type:complete
VESVEVIRFPQSCSDSPENRVSAEVIDMFRETLVVDIKVADKAEDEGFVVREIQDPLIVLNPFTAFNDDRSVHTDWPGAFNASVRERGGVNRIVRIGPGGAFRAVGVIKVDVGVDDHGDLIDK